jgi:hypothetical protein
MNNEKYKIKQYHEKNKKTENLKKENKLNQLLVALLLFIFGIL